jgi:hypothetical protein
MKKTKEQQKRIDYFAGLAMKCILTDESKTNGYSNNIKIIAENSVKMAKELIKQLDNEQ